jgi:hypothetical protein
LLETSPTSGTPDCTSKPAGFPLGLGQALAHIMSALCRVRPLRWLCRFHSRACDLSPGGAGLDALRFCGRLCGAWGRSRYSRALGRAPRSVKVRPRNPLPFQSVWCSYLKRMFTLLLPRANFRPTKVRYTYPKAGVHSGVLMAVARWLTRAPPASADMSRRR